MKFAQDNGCFTQYGDVRDVTKDPDGRCSEAHRHTGRAVPEGIAVETAVEEHEYAFDGGTGTMARKAAQSKSSLPKFDTPGSPRGAGPKAKRRGYPHRIRKQTKEDEALDFTTCMFCGMRLHVERGCTDHTTGRTALFRPLPRLRPGG